MTSTFVAHHTRDLILFPAQKSSVATSSIDATPSNATTHEKEILRSLVVSLNPPLSPDRVRGAISTLASLGNNHADASVSSSDAEEHQLRRAIMGKLTVGLYAEALDIYLSEASEVETEAEWWADIERSSINVARYLLQTLPARVLSAAQAILRAVRINDLPLRPSLFTPSSIRRLFPPTRSFRPNILTVALFPHLHHQPHLLSVSLHVEPPVVPQFSVVRPHSSSGVMVAIKATTNSLSASIRALFSFLLLPFELTRQECRLKRKELEKIRDERAETLGTLAEMRESLASALEESSSYQDNGECDKLETFMHELQRVMQTQSAPPTPGARDLFLAIQHFSGTTLQFHTDLHSSYIRAHKLHRPSRLTLIWPRLLLLPPAALYLLHKISASRATLEEIAREAQETVVGFFRDWLFEPLKGVVNTVRAGGEHSMLVSREGVSADIDSLERMTLSLAQDKLRYSQEQLDLLSRQIRLGDLTPVLQIYEEDIKSPLKSAVTGTLLRSVFVQVQKAKVDIDQALSGIDRLLKSQELTFAFVGVAPAFAIVYLVSGYARGLWRAGGSIGKYGGKKRRLGVWLGMRRIERLLISQPKSRKRRANLDERPPSGGDIPPLTAGLLLLSVARLRTFAETCLPVRSHLREGFLEDVEDLEDPSLGRAEKLRVVDRMWKSWGNVLGWEQP